MNIIADSLQTLGLPKEFLFINKLLPLLYLLRNGNVELFKELVRQEALFWYFDELDVVCLASDFLLSLLSLEGLSILKAQVNWNRKLTDFAFSGAF